MAKGHQGRGGGQNQQVQIDIATLAQKLNAGNPAQMITALEQHRGSRVLCLTYNDGLEIPGQLSFAVLPPFEQALKSIGHVPKLDVFLRCLGGMAEIPWRLVSLLREFTDELGVIVSKYALSGGCHIAISADDLIMTPFSVLGSVDPTRNHPLLPKDTNGKPIPTSVQDLKHCIEFIREQLGDSYPNQDLAAIVSELFKYVDPLAIGALEQSYNLARLITEKILKTHRQALDEGQVKRIVDVLSGKYYSHSFLISRKEVRTDLGLSVTEPDSALTALIDNLSGFYDAQFRIGRQLAPPNDFPQVHAVAFVNTTSIGWVEVRINEGTSEVKFDQWQKYI